MDPSLARQPFCQTPVFGIISQQGSEALLKRSGHKRDKNIRNVPSRAANSHNKPRASGAEAEGFESTVARPTREGLSCYQPH
jgi:hypothetical protein